MFGKSNTEIPAKYLCAHTKQLMLDPVRAADGYCYERSVIEDWIVKQQQTSSPITKALLKNQELKAEPDLQSEIKIFLQQNPLHLNEAFLVACCDGDVSRATKLLELGADIKYAKNDTGLTGLHLAAHDGKISIVNLLLERNASIEARDKKLQATPLHYAAGNGHREIVSKLSTQQPVDTRDVNGATPLHWACKSGYEVVVSLLLEKGADHEVRTLSGLTPLHEAAKNGNEKIIKLLLAKGAKVEARDELGITPLLLANKMKHPPVAKLLLTNLINQLIDAKDKKSLEDKYSSNNWSLLHWTVVYKLEEATSRLLLTGINPNLSDTKGLSPLHYVVDKNYEAFVEMLLKANADPFLADVNGITPIHLAAEKGHDNILKCFLKHAIDLNNAKANSKRTPLHTAVDAGKLSTVKLFADSAKNLNTLDFEGMTPLHLAIKKGHKEIVILLLQQGADYKIPNKAGQTPIQQATYCKQTEIIGIINEFHEKNKRAKQQAFQDVIKLELLVAEKERIIQKQQEEIVQLKQKIIKLETQPSQEKVPSLLANSPTVDKSSLTEYTQTSLLGSSGIFPSATSQQETQQPQNEKQQTILSP